MGGLTSYLQREFARRCPEGWACHREIRLLPADLEQMLGYSPRADVMLETADGSRRLWIEFEISRADPVANHAKFATAHLFRPLPPTDSFVAMVSSHVSFGRRNLAANTIHLMRYIGMNAFQTVLFPHLQADEIKCLNHLTVDEISLQSLRVELELERAFSVSDTLLTESGRAVCFAGDPIEVLLNVRRWNQEMATEDGRALWGRRTVTYFVYDPYHGQYAPSKFCAYRPLPPRGTLLPTPMVQEMEMAVYVAIDSADSRFDGKRARDHLIDHLGMVPVALAEDKGLASSFAVWHRRLADFVTLHPAGPVLVVPPLWFKPANIEAARIEGAVSD